MYILQTGGTIPTRLAVVLAALVALGLLYVVAATGAEALSGSFHDEATDQHSRSIAFDAEATGVATRSEETRARCGLLGGPERRACNPGTAFGGAEGRAGK